MPNIEFKNLTVKFQNKKNEVIALKNINKVFEGNKIHVILGFSGSGKSTLLRTLFDSCAYEGNILIDNEDILSRKVRDRNLGYVSQNYSLYPHLSIFENIAFPLKIMGAERDEIRRRVYAISEELNLSMTLSRKPRHISGGQQQRVAIARALIKNPSICLLDEPFSNLDNITSIKARELLHEVFKKRDITVLYVSHNVEEATSLGDVIHVLHDGEFIFSGTKEEFLSSNDEKVKEFIDAQ